MQLGPIQIRLKFGNQAYRVAKVNRGENAGDVARKLRELARAVLGLEAVRRKRTPYAVEFPI